MKIVNDFDLTGYLTLPQAAIYLGVAQTTMRRYALSERVLSSKTFGGHFRFLPRDLDAFIQEQGMADA